jgi:hypothetical protein
MTQEEFEEKKKELWVDYVDKETGVPYRDIKNIDKFESLCLMRGREEGRKDAKIECDYCENNGDVQWAVASYKKSLAEKVKKLDVQKFEYPGAGGEVSGGDFVLFSDILTLISGGEGE